jgi:SAM-dependent MidA family methyltransferase
MRELSELIADRIRSSGPISFAEYMELSLYHPALGYYARASQRTGRAGDFFTSVDVGPIFGELLARQFAEMWQILQLDSPFDLVEAAAGSGRLARDILDAAERHNPAFYAALQVSLVERSASARSAHADVLGPHATHLKYGGAVLPPSVTGVIFANELLDALPTHVAVMTDNGLREVFVDVRPSSGDAAPQFVERLDELSTPRIAQYLARAGAEMRVGWRAEVNLATEDWIKQAAASLQQGFLLLIDYGHEEHELYSGSHATGTLTSFTTHAQSSDVLDRPGERDVTAHVDLTAVTRAAEHAGLDVIARLDQTYFLLGLGAPQLEHLTLKQRLALKTLLLPGGLGSTHKVLIFGKGVGTPALQGASYRVRLT